jgi:hypothetical protein
VIFDPRKASMLCPGGADCVNSFSDVAPAMLPNGQCVTAPDNLYCDTFLPVRRPPPCDLKTEIHCINWLRSMLCYISG